MGRLDQLDLCRSPKLADEDWRNRARRRAYVRAVEEMLARTGGA